MPNHFAYIALLSWPLVTLYFLRKYGIASGVLLSLLGAYMFLPPDFGINPPAIPNLDKFTITTITICGYLVLTGKGIGVNALGKVMKLMFLGFLLSPFFTALTNTDRYLFIPGLKLYDGFSDCFASFLNFLPFLVGVKYFKSYEKQETLFRYFTVAAVIYSVLVLYEVRMSPQLNHMVYGYFPRSWIQEYRDGGFRAVVFMGHGLLVGMFLALGLASALVINKFKIRIMPAKNLWIVLFILVALILQKTLSALIYGMLALVMINFMSNKKMHVVAFAICVLFVSYPILSSMHLFPHAKLVEYASDISPQRAESLEFRFHQESLLLAHANKKPLFGWGGWGRNRLKNANTGKDESVTDGRWIITLGMRGWFGFLTEFIFVIAPIWMALRLARRRQISNKNEAFLLAAHSLVMGILLLDQMPNSSFNALYWLVSGALLGRVYQIKKENKNEALAAKNI